MQRETVSIVRSVISAVSFKGGKIKLDSDVACLQELTISINFRIRSIAVPQRRETTSDCLKLDLISSSARASAHKIVGSCHTTISQSVNA